MKRFATILALVLMAGVALFRWLNQLPPAPTVAGLLPSSTAVLLEFPDFSHTRDVFPQTAAGALWREPRVQACAADIHQGFLEMFGAPKNKKSAPPDFSVLQLAGGQLFLAITSFDTKPAPFKAIAGMDVTGHYLETKFALIYRESRLRAWNPEARFTSHKHLGVKYREWSLSPRFHLYHAFLNSLLVWTNDETLLRETIKRFTGQTKTSLADNPRFRAALRGLRANPEFVAYADLAPLVNQWPLLRTFSDADIVALGSTFRDKQIRDISYSIRTAPRHLPNTLDRFQTIIMTSPDSKFYRVNATNWETGYRDFAEALIKYGERTFLIPASQFERSLLRHGIRPCEDLFHFLGPETALIANWRPGARFPDIALAAELRDPSQSRLRLDVAMTALKEALVPPADSLPWDTSTFHGETIRTARLRTSVVAPSYFTTDKFFVIASTPDYARELIGQIKEIVPTLAMNPGYQQTLRHFPTNITAQTYCDLRAVAPPLLAHVQNGLRLRPSRFLHAGNLPEAAALTNNLAPYASVCTAGKTDDTTITISPLGKPVTLLLSAWLASKAILPLLFPATPTAPTTSSNTNAPLPPPGNPTAPSQTPSP